MKPEFGPIATTTTCVDPVTGVELDVDEVSDPTDAARRGDLLLIRGDQRLLIDVTIVRPTAPTHLNNPRLAVTTKGLACAAAAERAKHANYDEMCAQRGWTMIPFAVESCGSMGESARKLLHKLASQADDMSAHAFLQLACARISVALQAANASIAIGGLQRLRVDQLLTFGSSCTAAGDLPMSPGLGGHSSRRRMARHATRIHEAEVNLTAAFHGGF